MIESRPDPEKILQRVHDEERKERQGKLKIYLGAAPGVGKTYEMLRDAIDERNKGLDVIIGVAESHGREEIKRMMMNFEELPRQVIHYHDNKLFDFDIDAALKRNPGLILLDEMAHTNAPGQRHTKRWQDIKELLDRGINVYTTLNVQHIESLNDDVTQIIQAPVKETVPDFMIDRADTIELVDIPPEELLKRLHEGKIYIAQQAELAVEHFFRIGNLIALRALALRITAERVGAQVLSYRHDKHITQIWPTKEKILVCVGPGAESLKLIRAARRMATSLHAEWVAIYVETSRSRSSEQCKNNAIQNLRFAQQMGADTHFLSGPDIVTEVMSFAREHNVTQIMVWKTIRTRPRDLFFRHLADEIVRYSGEIDVYIMTGVQEKTKGIKIKKVPLEAKISWSTYAAATGIIVVATAINYLLYPYLPKINLIMVYLLSIIIVALYGQPGPSLLASVLSVLGFDFFFVSPQYSFTVNDLGYLFTFILMFFVSMVVSNLTLLTRRQADAARFSGQQASALYKLTRQLASTRGTDKLMETGLRFISQQFESKAVAFLAENGHLIFHDKLDVDESLSIKEQSIAQWVYDLGQPAGIGTPNLPFAKGLYLPLVGSENPIGVLRLTPLKIKRLLTPEQMHLLEACTNHLALAIEVDRTHEQKGKSALSRDKNYMDNALLRSIAHQLRAPLAVIMVAANSQIELARDLRPNKIRSLGREIYFESEQLNRLINNFLQITYLESRAATVHKQLHSLSDTLKTVLELFRLKLGNRRVKINMPENLPRFYYDNALIQDVFINLFDNVIQLTPPSYPLEISVVRNDEMVEVSVEDQGAGIMPDEITKLFEKFYRGRMITTERGLGLGLTICHRIIKAHGGTIWAENRKEGGAAFRFTLPLKV
ncbi:sensor histidine kinase [Legionella maioricensis]|uniref:histidine kinase n=1 Tax=Legionella maioricensis TaxID=2896528 RepID=A0A9X2IBB1_9GAMM|nr:sensor histidine kinase KdpD [Legionella maioricensis]MCL9683227.1 sensor histidine kinase KdpD [Legionella maioricensis]MCL9686075.1 sensor histidine kinase KdpD [Legionella maioricensis]